MTILFSRWALANSKLNQLHQVYGKTKYDHIIKQMNFHQIQDELTLSGLWETFPIGLMKPVQSRQKLIY